MNWLDIVIIVLLAIQFFTGLTTGFIRGLLSLIGLVAGIILAGQFYTQLAGALTFIHDDRWADFAAFATAATTVLPPRTQPRRMARTAGSPSRRSTAARCCGRCVD